jgi:putative addiction module CopG family antidote
MPSDLHLTPHLASFVRAQLQTGRFQTSDDVICAALSLLEEQSATAGKSNAWPKRDIQTELSGKPGDSVEDKLSSGHPDRPADQTQPTPEKQALSVVRRSPRGILADLHSHIDPEEIREARSEMWSARLDGHAE